MIDTRRLVGEFARAYGPGGPVELFFAPGRVNLIGEHIDYNGGLVFPLAIDRGIAAALRRRPGRAVRLASLDAGGRAEVDLDAPIERRASPAWTNYPLGVVRELAAAGHRLAGCDVLFGGDLPDGAGLSSSAALEVLAGVAMLAAAGVPEGGVDRTRLALLCQRAENDFCGVSCGIMDQFAVACGRAGHALLLDCRTLACEQVPFVTGSCALVIMNSGRRRGLGDSKYNERRAECEAALALLRARARVEDLAHADPADVEALVEDPVLARRARHVAGEQRRVLEAARVMREGDMAALGRLMCASHESLARDYEVTGPELDALCDEAVRAEGCLGARMTGAGFGGCAIALVETWALDAFAARVGRGYAARTGRVAGFYPCVAGDGARRLGEASP